ncbi:cation:proton antiporter [Lactobacillus acetotolerans]|uniref:cation:proton antiporter n=1 Tax=Lactobacillus acetotolerans TaxID=1600 RepID=UPI0019D2C1C6|nr:sodium:proton antiporter [Lactobacillus acetotolerans]MBN7276014.1 sodium:proton antiporter [Lactobacillus acetotolerans]
MHVLSLILYLVIAAGLAMLIQSWFLRKVSVNYVALTLGIIMALIPYFHVNSYTFKPELFLGIIVAPLLFFEAQGKRIYNIVRSWKSIIGITVIMTLIATILAAFSLKWLIGLSLPLSFILAAISTPTDATAAESVSHGLELPEKVENYLENESLLNDASGIILLNMAISWYLWQHLEIATTFINFLYSTIGGIVLGLGVSAILILIRERLVRVNLDLVTNETYAVTAITIFYVLTPALLYFLAQAIKVSGIITVVAAGLAHSAEQERSRITSINLTYNNFQITNTLTDILNSIVFIILGISIVKTMQNKALPNKIDQAILIGVLLYLINLFVRYLYSFFSLKLTNKNAWIFALGGIHGAVTFALAYTLDQTLISPNNFHLVLFSETTLIILSMLIPTIIFNFLLPKDTPDVEREKEVLSIRGNMVNYALEKTKKIYMPKMFRKQLEFDLKAQINETSMRDFLKELRKSIRHPELTLEEKEFRNEVYRYAFRQERNYLGKIALKELGYRKSFMSLYREILLAEVLFLRPDND